MLEGFMTRAPKHSQTPPDGLQTHHIFLDTEVYRQLGHNPDSPPLKALADHITANGLVLHTTDITLAEIRRQLREFVGKTEVAMSQACRQLGRWQKRHPRLVPVGVPEFNSDAIAQAAYKHFDAAATRWNVKRHIATDVPALQIFEKYFARQQPFESQGSKEFPDAFVVRALEKWCEDTGERMYVVTADKAMKDAVNASEVLLHETKLEDILAAVANTETPDIRARAEVLLKRDTVQAQLQAKVGENIEELILLYSGDLAEGEITGHEMYGEIELVDFKVIAASSNDISLMMEVRTPLLVQLDYEDRSDAIYDKEDDIYFGAETNTAEIEADPVIRLFAKLTRRPPQVSSVRILTGELSVSEPYEEYK
jgi:PIN domain